MIIQEPQLSGLSWYVYYVSSASGQIGDGEIIIMLAITVAAGIGAAGGGSGL